MKRILSARARYSAASSAKGLTPMGGTHSSTSKSRGVMGSSEIKATEEARAIEAGIIQRRQAVGLMDLRNSPGPSSTL